VDLTISFESGVELDLRASSGFFLTLASELAARGMRTLADSITAHARLIRIPDEKRVAFGRALAITIADL
jgi:hypothetical protein